METKTKKTLSQLAVGDDVAIVPWSNHGVRYQFGYKVVRKTPSGQVVVRRAEHVNTPKHELRHCDERKFDGYGYEMNTSSSKWYKDRLEADVEMAQSTTDLKKRQRDAAVALAACKDFEVRDTYSKESLVGILAELEAKVAAAKALVEAI